MNLFFNISFSAVKTDGWKSHKVTTTLLITLRLLNISDISIKWLFSKQSSYCFKSDFRYKQVTSIEPKAQCAQNVPKILKWFQAFITSTVYMLQTTKKSFESVSISISLPLCILVYFEWLCFLFVFLFFVFLAVPRGLQVACGILVPGPGVEPGSQEWKRQVLTTGPPGNSLEWLMFSFLCVCVYVWVMHISGGTMKLFHGWGRSYIRKKICLKESIL